MTPSSSSPKISKNSTSPKPITSKTSNQQTGSICASNHHHLTTTLAGEWNSGPWKSKSPTSRTPHSQFSWSSSPVLSSVSTSTFTFPSQKQMRICRRHTIATQSYKTSSTSAKIHSWPAYLDRTPRTVPRDPEQIPRISVVRLRQPAQLRMNSHS